MIGEEIIRDSLKKEATIELKNDFFAKDSIIDFKDFLANSSNKYFASGGSISNSEVDKLNKLDTLVNSKGTTVYKMYVDVSDNDWTDSTKTTSKKYVAGPLYYIKIPRKYYKELGLFNSW